MHKVDTSSLKVLDVCNILIFWLTAEVGETMTSLKLKLQSLMDRTQNEYTDAGQGYTKKVMSDRSILNLQNIIRKLMFKVHFCPSTI